MKIITSKLDKLLERQRFELKKGDGAALLAVAHLFHPMSNFDWYLVGYTVDGSKDYVFTLTNGEFLEYGDIYLPEMLELRVRGLGIERDRYFKPIDLDTLFKKLRKGN